MDEILEQFVDFCAIRNEVIVVHYKQGRLAK